MAFTFTFFIFASCFSTLFTARPQSLDHETSSSSVFHDDPCAEVQCQWPRQACFTSSSGKAICVNRGEEAFVADKGAIERCRSLLQHKSAAQRKCICNVKCDHQTDPVCGSDGLIYPSHCHLHRAAACQHHRHHIHVQTLSCSPQILLFPVNPTFSLDANAILHASQCTNFSRFVKTSRLVKNLLVAAIFPRAVPGLIDAVQVLEAFDIIRIDKLLPAQLAQRFNFSINYDDIQSLTAIERSATILDAIQFLNLSGFLNPLPTCCTPPLNEIFSSSLIFRCVQIATKGCHNTTKLQYKWYKDGLLLSPSRNPNKRHEYLDGGRQLRLHNLRPVDAGRYTCSVTTSCGLTSPNAASSSFLNFTISPSSSSKLENFSLGQNVSHRLFYGQYGALHFDGSSALKNLTFVNFMTPHLELTNLANPATNISFVNVTIGKLVIADANVTNLTLTNSLVRCAIYKNAFLVSSTVSNVTYENTDWINSTVINHVKINVTIINENAFNYKEINVTLQNSQVRKSFYTNSQFLNSVVSNSTFFDSTLTDVVSINHTDINVGVVSLTQHNVSAINYTAINVSLIDVSYQSVSFVNTTFTNYSVSSASVDDITYFNVSSRNYLSVNVTVNNLTKKDIVAVNYTGINVTVTKVASQNASFLNSTFTNWMVIDASLSNVTYKNVSSQNYRSVDVTVNVLTNVNISAINYTGIRVAISNGQSQNVSFVNSTFCKYDVTNATHVGVTYVNVSSRTYTSRNVSVVRLLNVNVSATNYTGIDVIIDKSTARNVTLINYAFASYFLSSVTYHNVAFVNGTSFNLTLIDSHLSQILTVNSNSTNYCLVNVTSINSTKINVRSINSTKINIRSINLTRINGTCTNSNYSNYTSINGTYANVTYKNLSSFNYKSSGVLSVNVSLASPTLSNVTYVRYTALGAVLTDARATDITYENASTANLVWRNFGGNNVKLDHVQLFNTSITTSQVENASIRDCLAINSSISESLIRRANVENCRAYELSAFQFRAIFSTFHNITYCRLEATNSSISAFKPFVQVNVVKCLDDLPTVAIDTADRLLPHLSNKLNSIVERPLVKC
ncbi:protein PF3D7_1417600-like [Oscarella lobularis]|uniref:protein PF3D7_1417600-like n=1 Tax=Oscarella lobularis TaxID=121494 RepID=UPI0033133015